MSFYSFKVHSSSPVVLPTHFLVIDEGEDVFNLSVADLDGFCQELIREGVKILEVNKLDDFEAVPPQLTF